MKSPIQQIRLAACLVVIVLGVAFAGSTSLADTPVIYETQEMMATDGGNLQWFGTEVDVDGETALVGAFDDRANGLYLSGAAYVFARDASGIWVEDAKLQPNDASALDYFGCCVAVHGELALVGAPEQTDFGLAGTGAAYAFTRQPTGEWTETAKLLSSDGAFNDAFGSSLAVEGDTALIGAPYHNSLGVSDSGAVYVLTRDASGIWSEQSKLVAGDAGRFAHFGASVSLHGDTAVIGAGNESSGGLRSNGAAYVFTRDPSGMWFEQAKLVAGDAASFDYFGRSVAVADDTALVGAPQKDSNGLENSGAVYVFTRDAGGMWSEQARLVASDAVGNGQFGRVSYDGQGALIGAPHQDTAYIFTRNATGMWTEQARLQASEAQTNASFGGGAIDGSIAVVGAPGTTDNGYFPIGAAYVFELPSLTTPVEIDLKPGNRRNVVNPAKQGCLWVAILSDSKFDALQVVPASVAFGSGAASPDRYRVKDVNRDRQPDLMLRFRVPEVGLQCGDTEIELTGVTYAGDGITGTDAVKTVGCKKPKKAKKE